MATITEIINKHKITFFDGNIICPPEPFRGSLIHSLGDTHGPENINVELIKANIDFRYSFMDLIERENNISKRFVTTNQVVLELEEGLKITNKFLCFLHNQEKYKEKKYIKIGERVRENISLLEDYVDVSCALIRKIKRGIYPSHETNKINYSLHELIKFISSYFKLEEKPVYDMMEKPESRNLLRVSKMSQWGTDADLVATAMFSRLYNCGNNIAIISNDSDVHRIHGVFSRFLEFSALELGIGKEMYDKYKETSSVTYADFDFEGSYNPYRTDYLDIFHKLSKNNKKYITGIFKNMFDITESRSGLETSSKNLNAGLVRPH